MITGNDGKNLAFSGSSWSITNDPYYFQFTFAYVFYI